MKISISAAGLCHQHSYNGLKLLGYPTWHQDAKNNHKFLNFSPSSLNFLSAEKSEDF